MSILVLGADGYLGWPLTCALAGCTSEPIYAVDDLSRRRRVAEEGFRSGVPILPFAERLARLRAATGRTDLAGVEAGVTECIEDLVREARPRAVVHLAQIPSAPLSMRSFADARATVENNVLGNLALLFALRDHSPSTHVVKMGSMGEYARCGVPIGEGYVCAVLDGAAATRPVLFPQEADDVYHVTKINDTHYLAMAARVWGIACTDVMQSVVYGVHTPLSRRFRELVTRFDCDPLFGSVLNRFVAQAARGVPLTVYGGGAGSTGLIALRDAVEALVHWISNPARPGEHRVINQATATRVGVLEIARVVRAQAARRGIEVTIDGELDPRYERERPTGEGEPLVPSLRRAGVKGVPLAEGIGELLDDVLPYADSLDPAAAAPEVDWKSGDARPAFSAPGS